ncbi:N-6 DNA methylase [Caballeronia sp. dw_19]|uniref:Eco57I restriction-modification methylase domain-containing protein n=1 Tax=Caballeronia sp. dw_19 TaxID=2719791 RepID=UPI001BD3981E|nr:N-6 DNA methylase [Caballeronia sp. dw_19]
MPKTLAKTLLKQHFTDAPDLKLLMCRLLGSVEGLNVLEPSVGHGAFLDGLLGKPKSVHACDVDSTALAIVNQKFSHLSITTHHCDFIDIFLEDLLSDKHVVAKSTYDSLISNPPYGLYFSLDYRQRLKQAYPDFYVRESYGLFFKLSVNRLREQGRYVFLLPDTFLSSKNHTPLRRFIVEKAAPTHIIRFPSKRFETVNFGYGNLCVIAGSHRALSRNAKIQWVDMFDDSQNLADITPGPHTEIDALRLYANVETGWNTASRASQHFTSDCWTDLGTLAQCKTGIYTGDNFRFIGYDPSRIKRRINGHPINWHENVRSDGLSQTERIGGLQGFQTYVPLIRGGHRQMFEHPSSAIDWSSEAIDFYKTDKKARLQNFQFYFRKGLSVPMVASGRISAAIMDNAIFDQGVVGVFPADERLIAPLLLYLNSSFASQEMKRIVNGAANNSANYLKRMPVPNFRQADIEAANILLAETNGEKSLSPLACDAFVQSVIEAVTSQDMVSNLSAGSQDDEEIPEINLHAN